MVYLALIRYLSLSARRAWIEIQDKRHPHHEEEVALRKESVDRNQGTKPTEQTQKVALRKESVDRNITSRQLPTPKPPVALRKESVDRNCAMQIVIIVVDSRSPQGERG